MLVDNEYLIIDNVSNLFADPAPRIVENGVLITRHRRVELL